MLQDKCVKTSNSGNSSLIKWKTHMNFYFWLIDNQYLSMYKNNF